MNVNGWILPVVFSEEMIHEETVEITRSVRERFFTLPLRPFVKTKTVVAKVPCYTVITDIPVRLGRPVYVLAHPILRDAIAEASKALGSRSNAA